MLTVFWSPVCGQTGTTTIFCSAAAYLERGKLDKKTLFLRTKYKQKRLAEVLHGKEERRSGMKIDGETEQGSHSIDQLVMARASGMSLISVLQNHSLLLEHNLELLEGSNHLHPEVYEKELEESILPILEAVQECYETVFLEAESGYSQINQSLFLAADRVYICIPQNLSVIEKCYEKERKNEKVHYILGNYDPDSILNCHNLSRRFHLKDRLTAFPYRTALRDAYSAGELEDYILRLGSKKSQDVAEKSMLSALTQIASE